MLQIIEKYEGECVPILHWFTGSVKDAQKAIKLGCWFSINPQMCLTATGKNIINCIPIDRVLPETDGPFTRKDGREYMPWDMTVVSYMAEENRLGLDEMNLMLHRNLESLIGIK